MATTGSDTAAVHTAAATAADASVVRASAAPVPMAPLEHAHAHVHALDLGPCLSHEDIEFLTYDDATAQLLAVKGGHVFAYDAATVAASSTTTSTSGAQAAAAGVGARGGGGGLRWMYPLQPGPRVMGLRPSLDNRLLAVQRGPALLEIVDLATGLCSVHSAHRGRGDILAFFFTDAPGADLVLVTTRAVEMNTFAAGRQGLRCRDRVRGSFSWVLYTHETRMAVAGSGPLGRGTLCAWQFASQGVVTLMPFQLTGPLPASAAVRQFLPAAYAAAPAAAQVTLSPNKPDGTDTTTTTTTTTSSSGGAGRGAGSGGRGDDEDGSNGGGAGDSDGNGSGGSAVGAAAPLQQQPQSAALLPVSVLPQCGSEPVPAAAAAVGSFQTLPRGRACAPAGLWLLKMYGRVYLARADLSVTDNVLLLHSPDDGVVTLLDVALPLRGAPLTSPLPLRRLALLPPGAAAAADGSSDGASTSGSSLRRAGSALLLPMGALAASTAGTAEDFVYESSELQHGPSWQYLAPGVILDSVNKILWKLHLDLQAIAASVTDLPALTAFLLRRRALPSGVPLSVDPRSLLVRAIRGALQDRLPPNVLRGVFDQILQAHADATARSAVAATSAPGVRVSAAPAAAAAAPAAAGPGVGALLPVPAAYTLTPSELACEVLQWASEEEAVDALDLQAAVAELCASCDAHGVAAPPYAALLRVDLLQQQAQHYQTVQLMYCQPGAGCAHLARHLLAAAGAAAREGGGGGGGAVAARGLLTLQTGPVASASSAVALELALDELARSATPELRGAVSGHTATAVLVRQLLSAGQVLRAARVAAAAGGTSALGVPPSAFLAAAAACRDAGAFASTYRLLRPHIVGRLPDLQSARRAFFGTNPDASSAVPA